jgi:hypothetical protein
MNGEQITNGKKIRFRTFVWSIHNRLMMEEDHESIKPKDKSDIQKDWIKNIYLNILMMKLET